MSDPAAQPERQPSADRVSAAVAPARGPIAKQESGISSGKFLAAAALVVLVVISYAPVLRDEFIWDDDAYVTQNGTLRSLHGLHRIWFVPFALPQYYPLVHTSFWIEYQLWGLNPAGYHLVNLLLHLASVLLLWRLLEELQVPGAWLAAAIFGVHPVHVESVAWVTERKNVLSLVLALASLLCYLRFAPLSVAGDSLADAAPDSRPTAGRWGWYAAALITFIAALLSKTVVASVPAVLLVIYWWKRGAVTWRDVAPLVPFFACGITAGLYTAWLERYDVGAAGDEWNFSPADRLLIAGRAAWFYATKLAWPNPLMFFYPRWVIDDHAAWQYLYPLAAAGLVAGLWLARGRIGRGPLAAVLIFGGVLVPVLGFFNVYPFRFSFVADHFQYHASIALIALAAAGIVLAVRHLTVDAEGLLKFLGALVLIVLVFQTFQRTKIFHDPEPLYRDTLAKNPDCAVALGNLAAHLADQGRTEEALPLAREAVALWPHDAIVQNNLGMVLLRSGDRAGFAPGQLEEAIQHIEESLRLEPNYVPALSNLAYTLMKRDRPDEAIEQFQHILEISPTNSRALFGRAAACELQGKKEEAIDAYRRSLEVDPGFAQARYNLAQLLMAAGAFDGAIVQARAMLQMNPANLEALLLLGQALHRRGDLDGAAQQFDTVLRLQPNHVPALLALSAVLIDSGRSGQAAVLLQDILRRQPDHPQARALLNRLQGASPTTP